jgi:uncharacterized LabA/DUF88 family protein
MSNLSIIWDVENVTPNSSNTLFIDGLWDYAESLGRVVSARAYCDYSIPAFKRLALQLKKFHFYLVHVPSEKNKKNSVDMQLTSDTLELLRLYEHIDHFLLITGDSDFRPLLLTLRRTGKLVTILCDIKTASQELLALADNFIDYRDLLPGEDDEQDNQSNTKHDKDYWFGALAETATILQKEKKSQNFGSVKIRMKMLNPGFNESKLGYKRWSDFITAAAKKGFVTIAEEDTQPVVEPAKGKEKGVLQRALQGLIRALEELDEGKKANFHEYSLVSSKIRDYGIDIKDVGYRQFKKFIQAADIRGLVDSKSEGMKHYVKRSL